MKKKFFTQLFLKLHITHSAVSLQFKRFSGIQAACMTLQVALTLSELPGCRIDTGTISHVNENPWRLRSGQAHHEVCKILLEPIMSHNLRDTSMVPCLLALLLTAALPNLAPATSLIPFRSEPSRIANLSSLETRPGNEISPSPNFIGVECYHLDPQRDMITRQSCQWLFDNLVSGGHVYEEKLWYNNFRFYSRHHDCTIKIYSPTREDRYLRISLSLAQIMLYAIEVLDDCRESGTGGANVIQGDWRVAVSRDVLNDILAPP